MRRPPFVPRVLTALCLLTLCAAAAAAQASVKIPKISERRFSSGSAKVTVTGSLQISQEITLNETASFGDGEMTWMQFGVSGAQEPNALITVSEAEIGVSVAKGKGIATGTVPDSCTGKMDVTPTSVSGRYTCRGLTSYNPGAGGLGTVNVEVTFTAKS